MAGVSKAGVLGAVLVGVGRTRRVLLGVEHLVEGVALRMLSDEQLSALTAYCYAHGPLDTRAGLFGWEERWFERDLPPAPAKLLLGGAGDGRELRYLQARGYAVTAFDPAASPAASEVLPGRYEDLIHEPPTALLQTIQARAPFDAVILGWGSLNHMPSPAGRMALLTALGSLCQGPILASFWLDMPSTGGRAFALGARLAKLAKPSQRASQPGDTVRAHCGFAHSFTEVELQSWASSGDREVRLHRDGYPHATLTMRRHSP